MLDFLKSLIKSTGRGITNDPGVRRLIDRYPKFFNFLRKRFSPNEKFGLHLTLGLIIAAIFIFYFFSIIQDIIAKEPLLQSDLRIINLVQIFRIPDLNSIMLLITHLAKWHIVFAGVAIISILFALFRKWDYLIALIISTGGGEIFVWIAKHLMERSRPPVMDALLVENSFSFPSGHSFAAFSFYGLLAYFLFLIFKNKFLKLLTVILGVAMILAIGFSRIYLGAHWPSDVLASYAAGAAWLTLIITALEIRRKFYPRAYSEQDARYIGRTARYKTPYLKKSLIAILGVILFSFWGFFIFYYYQTHPLKPPPVPIGKQIIISEKDIPQDFFINSPRSSEDIVGAPMEPINIIVIGSQDELGKSMEAAGWFPSDPITFQSVWRLTVAIIFNKPYPNAPATPSFWDAKPNDFSFTQPTSLNSARERYHIHFWQTSFLTNEQKVWFATAHLDQTSTPKYGLTLPIHIIDPAVDKARDKIKDELLAAGNVQSVQELQIVESILGRNQAGQQFFTDGKAYIIFLKTSTPL